MKRLGSFFDEIYGFDGMSSFLLFISVILNLVTGMWPSQAVNNFNLISYLPLLGCIFRVFSRNHERRAHENECFLKLARPLCENIIEKREEQAEAKLFRFFKCPVCKQKLRVPKGKGKVEITCPKCGKKAEVYSRITGYYRPVQNWNDGKAQEYKNRTVYDILHSGAPAEKPVEAVKEERPVMGGKHPTRTMVTMTKDDVKIQHPDSVKYLFTTSTCPNCKIAKQMLAEAEEEYQLIDAEKNPELVSRYGIMQAQTLVVIEGDETKKYVNASNIQKYVEENE